MRSTAAIRRIPALLGVAALLTASLAGCSGASPASAAATRRTTSGDASSLVTATGDVGSPPDVDFPTPLVVDEARGAA